MKDESLKVKLFEYRGETSVFIDARIDDDGNFVVSGQDIGKAPMEHFRDSDYEYWIFVPSDQKDPLLLALIQKLYEGNSKIVSEFMDLMKTNGISYRFSTF
ncbi:MAG: hypothetical protein ACXABY_32845 [Candidatus Thorarchaeota archaeon]|jgi:hypothetical protein